MPDQPTPEEHGEVISAIFNLNDDAKKDYADIVRLLQEIKAEVPPELWEKIENYKRLSVRWYAEHTKK